MITVPTVPTTVPHKFKKPGGGRGRPSPQAFCSECGVIWIDHAKAEAKPHRPRPRPHPSWQVPQQAPHHHNGMEMDEAEYIEPGVEYIEPAVDPEPVISLEEQTRIEWERAERSQRFWDHMKNWWVEKEMAKDPQQRDRAFWTKQHDDECEADW